MAEKINENLADNIFQFLIRYGRPVTENHIGLLFNISGAKNIGILHDLLISDSRFDYFDENATWKLVPLSQLLEDRLLKETTFIITDIESTGSIKGKDRIIEIAALKVRNGEVLDQFDHLVDPEKKISHQIIRVTGISNQDVEGAPLIEEILPKFVEFVGSDLFVAHNSYFDYLFINAELRRLGLAPLATKIDICTFRLAKALLPKVRARGISGLATYFGYEMTNRHRAMPDVEATKFYLDRFFELMARNGDVRLHQLVELQRDAMAQKTFRKKIRQAHKKKFFKKS